MPGKSPPQAGFFFAAWSLSGACPRRGGQPSRQAPGAQLISSP
nr:MAG TPA: hypothetical protein [Caudoviricetes sp.]